jgi:hypothetical protein
LVHRKVLARSLGGTVLLLACAGCAAPPASSAAVDSSPKPGGYASPVVVFDEPTRWLFPPDWFDPPLSVEFTVAPAEERERSKAVIRAALAKYPARFPTDTVARVVLVRSMRGRGVEVGGSYAVSLRTVYVCSTDGSDRKEAAVERTVHHELSSLVLRLHGSEFPSEEWARANPPGFEYGPGGLEFLATRGGDDGRVALVRDPLVLEGFVNEYAKSSLEEDFNTVAELVMSNPAFAHYLAARSPRLKQKIDLMLGFYKEVWPDFVPPQ